MGVLGLRVLEVEEGGLEEDLGLRVASSRG